MIAMRYTKRGVDIGVFYQRISLFIRPILDWAKCFLERNVQCFASLMRKSRCSRTVGLRGKSIQTAVGSLHAVHARRLVYVNYF